MNIKRILYLIKQDFRTCLTFRTTAILIVIPISFCLCSILLRDGDLPYTSTLYSCMFCAIFNTASLSACVLPILISKEKEEKTLHSLYLCGIKTHEFVIAKLCAIILLLICTTSLFFIGCPSFSYYLFFLVLHILCAFCMFPIGLLLAIFSKDINHTNDLATPIIIILILFPIIRTANAFLSYLAALLPTSIFPIAMEYYLEHKQLSLSSIMPSLITFILWFIFGWCIFLFFYRKYKFRISDHELIHFLSGFQNNLG